MAELQEMARLAAKYVNTTNKNVFLTGKAGTGKTTFLKYIKDHTFKNTVVAAPTGIAAINAGGVTLHSLLQLPFGIFIPASVPITDSQERINTPQTLFRERKFNATKRKLIMELELLIIDEVSMLRADLLDCIDFTLRFLRKRRGEPFGGVQILFIGDLLQLPPVIKEQDERLLNSYYPSPYFFDAHALKENPPILVELNKIFRQSDSIFIEILNRLRHNEQTSEDIKILNSHFDGTVGQYGKEGYIYLTTHNRKADDINLSRLNKLEGKAHTYHAAIEGEFPENMYPTSLSITLKKGAQVMFIKNDPTGQGQYFNGKIGHISDLYHDCIYVSLANDTTIEVPKYSWENKRYTLNKETGEIEEKSLGEFNQYPIKLAWAVTIHKSQGLTFDKAILDLSATFAPGQLYVALSRLTSLDGLILSSPLPEYPPSPDDSLLAFIKDFHNAEILQNELSKHRKTYIQAFTKEAFGFLDLTNDLYYHEKSFNKDDRRSIKQQYQQWTNELLQETEKLKTVGDKFILQVDQILQDESYLTALTERMQKARLYFEEQLNQLIEKLQLHLKTVKKEKQVKAYVKELEELESKYLNQAKKITKLVMLIEHAVDNKILTKADLQKTKIYNQVRVGKNTPPKEKKTPTAQISYDLYKTGKSIEEIAKERGLVQGTIAGHLARYVAVGEIPISNLLDEEKLKKIAAEYNKGISRPGELKATFGDSIDYGEINLALAHLEWLTGKQ